MPDRLELQRLAEELAIRENGTPATEQHQLPPFIPLSHEHPLLSSATPTFDVDAFLLTRTHTSLADLRSELRDYLGTLKEELVQLINDDYAAFISLSTDLRGEGARLERLRFPLDGVRKEIELSRSELEGIQRNVEEQLAERGALREEKALLHMLLKLSDSVARLETLLLISSPQESNPNASLDLSSLESRDMNGTLSLGSQSTADDVQDDRQFSRGGQAKHLARVAAEYNQLLYHAEKARSEGCAFVTELQWRVDRIKSTLSRDLDSLFSAALLALTSSTSELSSAEKTRWIGELSECFRTYDVLESWREAEEVVRRDIVRPAVKEVIFSGALAVPHSPVLPRTPFPNGDSLPPTTPFTPAIHMSNHDFFGTSNGTSHLPLLDESDDSLATLFNKLLRFIERNLRGVMDVAEQVAKKSTKRGKHAMAQSISEPAVNGILHKDADSAAFELMANVVWAEIGRALMDELGSVIFAAGRPDDFRKNYTTAHDFLAAIEFLAPATHSVEAMRSHPIYTAFEQRWQLPVYFQLRWKEIVGKLENSLLHPEDSRIEDREEFMTPAAYAVFSAVRSCWTPEVYIAELGHRFWRLTLQILSRYKTHLNSIIPAREPPSRAATLVAGEKAPPGSPGTLSTAATRPSTPMAPTENPETTAADDASLKLYAFLIMDIHLLSSKVARLWSEKISTLLPSEGNLDDGSLEYVLKVPLADLSLHIPDLSDRIIAILTRRCSEPLQLVRSIPSQYRAMNNKRDPSEPSYFVASILKPIKLFFDIGGFGSALRDEFGTRWTAEIFEVVVSRYAQNLSAMKKTEDSLRRYKKGKKSAFSLFGNNAGSKLTEDKDEERVRVQMVLDVEALGQDAKSLGVEIELSAAYVNLLSVAGQFDVS